MGNLYRALTLTSGANAYLARPSGNTTTYTSGDIVSNNPIVPLSVSALSIFGTSDSVEASIRRARFTRTKPDIASASFRVHLLTVSPTISSADNVALSMSGRSGYLGAIDVTLDQLFTDGAAGIGYPNVGSEILFSLPSSGSLYAVIEARGAVAPNDGEQFTVTLEMVLG